MTIENLELPKGRIVSGNPAKTEQKTNFQTKQPVLNNGVPVEEWRCMIAIPKQEFLTKVWPLLQKEAVSAYPNWTMIMDQATGLPLETCDFSWKIVDGDSSRCAKGSKVPYNQREGFPGHYVLKLSTQAFAPPVYKYQNGAFHQISASDIKCGDYVIANINVRAHTNNDGGLYLNPNGYQLVEYGKEIASTTSDPNALFTSKVELPSNTTVPTLGFPNPVATMPVAGAPLPPPAHDFVQNAVGGAAQPFPQPPVANVGMPQVSAPPMVGGTAPAATSFPTNFPGMPPAR